MGTSAVQPQATVSGFGQRLTQGAAPAAPAAATVPGNIAPGGAPTTGADDPNQKTLQQSSQMGLEYSRNLAAQPTLEQKEAPLEAQRKELATPLNPMDPQYRPTRWQRFGRGVLGGLEGLAEHGIAGAVMGAVDPKAVGATAYGAPNRAFSLEAQKRAGQLASVDQQEKNIADTYKEDTGRSKDVITSINDIGKNAAAGQTSQARADTAQAREETARVAGQLADIKQQVADYQSNGKTPTTYEGTVAAAALEPDPTRKAALNAAAKTMASTELKKFQYKAAADGEPRSVFRQSMIDAATSQVQALQDKYDYNPRRNEYVNHENPNDVKSPSEFTDLKNEIATKLDAQLGQKKMQPLGVRFNPADAGAGKPTGRAARQAATTPAATTPAAAATPPPGATHQYRDKSGAVVGYAVNGKYVAAGAK
jgi:hypothetical protein